MSGVITHEVFFWIGIIAFFYVGIFAPRILLLPFEFSFRVLDRLVEWVLPSRTSSKHR